MDNSNIQFKFKPFVDALAQSFDDKLYDEDSFTIYKQSENEITDEDNPCEYLETITGQNLPENICNNVLTHWSSLEDLIEYISDDADYSNEYILHYNTTGFTGSSTSFQLISLYGYNFIFHYIDAFLMNIFLLEMKANKADLSSFIVDYDTYNGKVLNQGLKADCAPFSINTEYIDPERLERAYRDLLNERYKEPVTRQRDTKDIIEAIRGKKLEYYRDYLDSEQFRCLERVYRSDFQEYDIVKLVDILFTVLFNKNK